MPIGTIIKNRKNFPNKLYIAVPTIPPIFTPFLFVHSVYSEVCLMINQHIDILIKRSWGFPDVKFLSLVINNTNRFCCDLHTNQTSTCF